MASKPVAPPDEGASSKDDGLARLTAAVTQAVMTNLGRPADFLRVTARRVAGANYRVNVVTGANPAVARIAHSFFVTADDAGRVVESTPAIERLY